MFRLWLTNATERTLVTRPAQFLPCRVFMYLGLHPLVDLGKEAKKRKITWPSAIHEIGHAYVALSLGIPLKTILFWKRGAVTVVDLRNIPHTPETIYDHMTCALAGSIIEILCFGSANPAESLNDLFLAKEAGEFLSDCWGSPFDEIFAGATEDAQKILTTPYAREICLRYAQLLERQGYLTKTQLKRLDREIQAHQS